MNSAWALGDKVVLASGGPTMTVVDIGQHTDWVFCKWAREDGQEYQYGFPAEALRGVES